MKNIKKLNYLLNQLMIKSSIVLPVISLPFPFPQELPPALDDSDFPAPPEFPPALLPELEADDELEELGLVGELLALSDDLPDELPLLPKVNWLVAALVEAGEKTAEKEIKAEIK